jgi:hypothetical protein
VDWNQFHPAYVLLPLWLGALLLRRRRRAGRRDGHQIPHVPSRAFGYKSSWLAVRSIEPAAVADALGLQGVHQAIWADAVDEARIGSRAVLVTPPVDGWVLALGPFQECEGELARLSTRFGEAQFFGTHRVSGYDEWQRWVDGEPIRRYAYAEGVQFDEGERTPIDAHVPTAEEDAEWMEDGADDPQWPDEDLTIAMARQWSVDPTTLDDREDLPSAALIGHRPQTAADAPS